MKNDLNVNEECPESEKHMKRTQEWKEGWRAGFNEAAKASARNIEHFKARLGDSAKGNSETSQLVRTLLQGVDLYVAVPPLTASVTLEDW